VDPRRLTWHEFVAMAGGVLLAIGLFLPWYSLENSRVQIAGMDGPGDFTAWEVHSILRWLFLAAAAAPLILSYIVARGHKLSWARGEFTAVVAIAAFGLAGYNGLVDPPSTIAGLTGTKYGFFVSLLGIMMMMVGSALRASESERPRKPPGVL
jgi:hypothetical protein